MSETKPCTCGKLMIQRYDTYVLATDPPQYPWQWWCGACGRTEEGGITRGIDIADLEMAQWRAVNGVQP